MKIVLALLAITLPVFSAVPAVTITGVDGVSHSVARISYQTDVVYDHWRTRTLVSPAVCAGNALGVVGPDINLGPGVSHPTSNTSVLVAGLAASTTYNVCVDAHNDEGWSTGASSTITTLALPNPHPALPVAPESWDSSYPDTGDFATMPTLPSVNGNGYGKVVTASDCSDLQADITDALWNQKTRGTVVVIPAGSVCTSIQQIQAPVFAQDMVTFRASAVTAGSPGSIAFPHATFAEGQLVTFGRHYADGTATPPSSGSCRNGNGFIDAEKYYIHIASDDGTTQTVNIDCGDSLTPGPRMDFGDVGSTTKDLQFVPHYLTAGTCPTAQGPKSCNYWARHMFWVIVRSSTPDDHLPPVGTRANDAYAQAGYYATLVNPTANIGHFDTSHFYITSGTGDGQDGVMTGNFHWGPGIRVMNANDTGNGTYCAMVGTGGLSGFVLDRVILKGTGYPQRWGGQSCAALFFNGHNFAFRDSAILNMNRWSETGDIDGSSITLSNGPGPITIYNNEIMGAGAPLMHFDDQGGTQHITRDNSVIRNHFFVPTKFMPGQPDWDGQRYGHRQDTEFKAGERNLLEGNIYDGNMTEDVPTSSFIVLTSVNGKPITDTAIYRNIFRHGPGGNTIQVVGGNARITLPPNRYAEIGNLFYDIDGTKYTASGNAFGFVGRGWFAQGPNGGEDIILRHNTIVGNVGPLSTFFSFSNYPTEGISVTDNFMYISKTNHAITQDGDVTSNACSGLQDELLLNCWLTPSNVWSHNVMLSGDGSKADIEAMFPGLKTSNYIPTDMSLANIWLNMSLNDYHVLSTYCSGCGSPGLNRSTVGADIQALDVATGAVELTGVPEAGLTTTGAHVQFNAPDTQGCPVDWSTAPDIMASFTRVPDAGGARSRDITLTGLSAHTVYYYRVNCATVQPVSQFKTR